VKQFKCLKKNIQHYDKSPCNFSWFITIYSSKYLASHMTQLYLTIDHVYPSSSAVQHTSELLYTRSPGYGLLCIPTNRAVDREHQKGYPSHHDSLALVHNHQGKGQTRSHVCSPIAEQPQVFTSVSGSECRLGCPVSVQTRANTESQKSETRPYHAETYTICAGDSHTF